MEQVCEVDLDNEVELVVCDASAGSLSTCTVSLDHGVLVSDVNLCLRT